jgi:hypothetical protein
VTPEVGELLDKARDCLGRACTILAAGSAKNGRDAYLAAFRAAQVILRAHRPHHKNPSCVRPAYASSLAICSMKCAARTDSSSALSSGTPAPRPSV